MRPAGLKAFAARKENNPGSTPTSSGAIDLDEPYAGLLAKNKAARKFFDAQPPGYRKIIGW